MAQSDASFTKSFNTGGKLRRFNTKSPPIQKSMVEDILHIKIQKLMIEPVLKEYHNDYESLLKLLQEDNWITMVEERLFQRQDWSIDSEVEIFSKSGQCWYPGLITKIINDKEGEWLYVEYYRDCQKIKEKVGKPIKRFDIYIRFKSSQKSLSSQSKIVTSSSSSESKVFG